MVTFMLPTAELSGCGKDLAVYRKSLPTLMLKKFTGKALDSEITRHSKTV